MSDDSDEKGEASQTASPPAAPKKCAPDLAFAQASAWAAARAIAGSVMWLLLSLWVLVCGVAVVVFAMVQAGRWGMPRLCWYLVAAASWIFWLGVSLVLFLLPLSPESWLPQHVRYVRQNVMLSRASWALAVIWFILCVGGGIHALRRKSKEMKESSGESPP